MIFAIGMCIAKNALGCGPYDRQLLRLFPHYEGRELEARSDFEGGVCLSGFATDASREEGLDYYEGKLRERGWEVHRGYATVYGEKGRSDYFVEYEDYEVPKGHRVTLIIAA